MTTVADNREAGLLAGYRATDWTAPIPYEDYAAAMGDWTVKALMKGDECIGAVYVNGDELHVSVVPEWRKRWVTRSVLRELFAAPRVVTRVTPGHEHMHGVLKRLGFAEHNGFFVRGASDGN